MPYIHTAIAALAWRRRFHLKELGKFYVRWFEHLIVMQGNALLSMLSNLHFELCLWFTGLKASIAMPSLIRKATYEHPSSIKGRILCLLVKSGREQELSLSSVFHNWHMFRFLDNVHLLLYDGYNLWGGDIPKMQGMNWLPSYFPRPLFWECPSL